MCTTPSQPPELCASIWTSRTRDARLPAQSSSRVVHRLGGAGALDPLVVALGLEQIGELGPAFLDEPAADEDGDVVGRDVAQDARVVGDGERAGLAAIGPP